jgi:hypothetical protein
MPWTDEKRMDARQRGLDRWAHWRAAGLVVDHDPVALRAKYKAETLAARERINAILFAPENIWKPKPKTVKITKKQKAHGLLLRQGATSVYPYIATRKPDKELLLEVSRLIPKTVGSDIHGDVCQEALLAIIEGKTTLDALRAYKDNARFFIKKFYKENFEASGRAVSLDGIGDDERSYDEIASSIAAREWREGQMNDRRSSYDALARTFYAPTQIDDVWQSQVIRKQNELAAGDVSLDFEEVAEMLAA